MSEMATLPGYYTPKEAAEVIGVSQSQITRYIQQGLLDYVSLGRQYLLEQGAVHRFKRRPVGNPNFGKKNRLRKSP